MEFDASDFASLAFELGGVSGRTHAATRGVFREAAHEVKEEWRTGAAQSSGEHAKFYPKSITWDEKFGTNLDFEVGPEVRPGPKEQGFLGPILEFGGEKSPAHLDGQRAADKVLPSLERRAAIAAEDTFNA